MKDVMMTAMELIEQLNTTDEITTVEAKRGSAIDRSIMESVCAFCNEPGLGGGHILLGVIREDHSMFPSYEVTGILNPDQLQLDISTQCASRFNQPIRPEVRVEQIGEKKCNQHLCP